MLSTINDLIEISKIESGSLEVKKKDVKINEQLDFVYKFFRHEATAKGLTLKVHKTLPALKALVKTDEEKLNGVLINLIKNAIKYTHSGRIEFGYRLAGNNLEFFVKDTGIGIEKKHQELVFDRFVQADLSLSKPYEGAGLGLSIAKAYVEIMGGEIWLQSEIAKGTQFYFTIPYEQNVDDSPQIPEIKSGLSSGDALKKLKILVAEDDYTSRMYISELLKEKCKELIFAANGKEAVDLFEKNNDFDLVLMDMKMPVMDGYEATEKIKKINPGIVVIAQTAYALAGDKEKAIAAGCDDYLPKPFNGKHLVEIAAKYFD